MRVPGCISCLVFPLAVPLLCWLGPGILAPMIGEAEAAETESDSAVQLRGPCGTPTATVPADFAANRARFHRKLATLRWVDYSPSSFDPTSSQAASVEGIREDLRTLAQNGFKPDETGICTYGCSPKLKGDAVAGVARELGFGGMILGVWSIDEDSEELPVARRLAAEGLVDAICMGNEGIFFSRYGMDRLRTAIRQMRAATGLPVSTSEVIGSYGNRLLTDGTQVDWVYPNVHPVFHERHDPAKAAAWVNEIIGKLAERTTLPILVHETGWPSDGLAHHTEQQQFEFWRRVLKSRHRFAIFEAFDQSWKHEIYQGVDIGTSWGWFAKDRKAKAVVGLVRDASDSALRESGDSRTNTRHHAEKPASDSIGRGMDEESSETTTSAGNRPPVGRHGASGMPR